MVLSSAEHAPRVLESSLVAYITDLMRAQLQGSYPEMFDAPVEVLAAAVAADSSAQVLQNAHREQVQRWRRSCSCMASSTMSHTR